MNLAALKSPSFRAYLFTVLVSLNGFWAQRVIIGWLAWELTGSAAFVGLVAFLNFCPTFIGGPLFGVLADKIDVRRGSIMTYSTVGVASLIFALIAFSSWMAPIVVAAFSLIIGTVQAVNHPLRMSLTPRLAPVKHMASVIALSAVNFNVSRLLGPAIGGVLIQSIGAAPALLVTAMANIPVVIALCFVHTRTRTKTKDQAEMGYVAALFDGIRHVLDRRLLRLAILVSGLCAINGRAVLDTLPILADGVYGRGPTGLGLMTAAAGAGALAASVLKVLARAQRVGEVSTLVMIMVTATPLLVTSLGMINSFNVALIVTTALGFSITFMSIAFQSLLQMALEDSFRGRVMSLWTMVTIGGASIGAMTMGIMSDALGIATAQMTIGLVCLIPLGFAQYGLVRHIRRA